MATITAPSVPPASSAPVDESSLMPKKLVRARPLFDRDILSRAR